MTDDYRTYTFTLGESPERIYKGVRAPVSQGSKFAFEVINKWKMIVISFVADAQHQQKMQDGEMTEKQRSSLELQFILKLCAETDLEEIMAQGTKIVESQTTQIIATESNSPKSFALSNKNQFDDWFEKYPQDLMQVYGYAIWNNVKPFISSFMDTLTAAGAMEEQADPLLNKMN